MSSLHRTQHNVYIFHYLSIPFENLLLRLKFFRFFNNTCVQLIIHKIVLINFTFNIDRKKKKTHRSILIHIFLIPKFHWNTRKNRKIEGKRRSTTNTRERGNCGDRKKRGEGEQLYNPNLSRDFRPPPLICFPSSRNRNQASLSAASERSIFLRISWIYL